MENKKEIPLFALSSIGGRIGSGLVSSLYNFTNEVNAVQYVIEINDYNKPLLNKYELRFASEKFTFDEIIAIGNEFKTFIPNKKTLSKVETSYEADQMLKSLNVRFSLALDEISKKLNEKFKNKMEKRKIQITIETAERWYNGCDRELKELAVQTFPELEKNKLPKIWYDLKEIAGYYINSDSETVLCMKANGACSIGPNKNVFATKEQAEASVALAQLSQLREVYRNGWVPDWSDGNKFKYCIEFYQNKIHKQNYLETSQFLSFKDPETRDLFLENFRDLIEKAKPFMQ